MLKFGRDQRNGISVTPLNMGGKGPDPPRLPGVNLRIVCPHCNFDVWITGAITGCRNRDHGGPSQHHLTIRDVIATKTTMQTGAESPVQAPQTTHNGQDPKEDR